MEGRAGGGKPESSKSLSIPVQPARNVRTFEETEETFHAPRYTRASPYPRHHSRDFEDEDKEEQQLRERRNARGKNDEERFLDVDLPEGVLNLGSVVLRDVHVLRKFDVVNRSPSSPLHLTLASTLPDEQVGFQLTNANLQGELEEEDHNQLFNTINRINELTLGPLERKSIILSFLPINQIPDANAHREVCTTRREQELSSFDFDIYSLPVRTKTRWRTILAPPTRPRVRSPSLLGHLRAMHDLRPYVVHLSRCCSGHRSL